MQEEGVWLGVVQAGVRLLEVAQRGVALAGVGAVAQ